jgi:hypothetical protein
MDYQRLRPASHVSSRSHCSVLSMLIYTVKASKSNGASLPLGRLAVSHDDFTNEKLHGLST